MVATMSPTAPRRLTISVNSSRRRRVRGTLAGRSTQQGMKRSLMVAGYGIPLAGCWPAPTGTTPRCWQPPRDRLDELGPLPEDITVHLDSGYDSGKTRDTLAERGLRGQIAHKGEKAPIQASRRWHVERTSPTRSSPSVP
jgi:IS5 family transposase